MKAFMFKKIEIVNNNEKGGDRVERIYKIFLVMFLIFIVAWGISFFANFFQDKEKIRDGILVMNEVYGKNENESIIYKASK